MQNFTRSSILAAVFCFSFTIANAQQAAIRFSCDGDSRGAQLFINGKHIGDCPMDQAVPAGQIKIRAVKKWGDEQERVFELDTFLGPGGAKRVEVELGPLQLTPAAREAQRLKQEAKLRAEREEKRRRDELIANVKAKFEAEKKQAEEFGAKAKADAEAGDVQAMVKYASHLQLGQGLQRDLERAMTWYTKAAAQGSAAGMAGVASLHFNSRNFEEALPWAEKAANMGEGRGIYLMSLLHAWGLAGLRQNTALAADLLQRAVTLDEPRALFFYGEALLGRGIFAPHFSVDKQRAYEIIRKGAEARDGLYFSNSAIASLSKIYKTGLNNILEKNEDVARMIWAKSQELGSAQERFQLGGDYMLGRDGMPQDDREALRLFRLAAEENHADSLNNIGFFYQFGRGGLPVDLEQAKAWYHRAAILGSDDAKNNLSIIVRGN